MLFAAPSIPTFTASVARDVASLEVAQPSALLKNRDGGVSAVVDEQQRRLRARLECR